ncbi:hypothetical protein [Peterkaempfera sp. SMS 1(5)a]|uniref:HAAS signaling domain-containing protein n=1 Tax=Peterkaempfera podocarpi TaxID=3232308 RepID=UPI00366B5716
MTPVRKQLVMEYLRRLDNACTLLPPPRRQELGEEIREHIEAALDEAEVLDADTVRAVLERLGQPADIVAAELQATPARGLPAVTGKEQPATANETRPVVSLTPAPAPLPPAAPAPVPIPIPAAATPIAPPPPPPLPPLTPAAPSGRGGRAVRGAVLGAAAASAVLLAMLAVGFTVSSHGTAPGPDGTAATPAPYIPTPEQSPSGAAPSSAPTDGGISSLPPSPSLPPAAPTASG